VGLAGLRPNTGGLAEKIGMVRYAMEQRAPTRLAIRAKNGRAGALGLPPPGKRPEFQFGGNVWGLAAIRISNC
jgi:hypothetical protein